MTINYQHLRILGAPLSDRPKLPRPVWEVDDYFEGRQALFLMAAGVLWRQRRTNIEHRGLLQLQSIKLWLNNSHRGWNLVMLSFHSPSFPPLYLGCWEQPCSEAESQIAKQAIIKKALVWEDEWPTLSYNSFFMFYHVLSIWILCECWHAAMTLSRTALKLHQGTDGGMVLSLHGSRSARRRRRWCIVIIVVHANQRGLGIPESYTLNYSSNNAPKLGLSQNSVLLKPSDLPFEWVFR